MTDDVRDNIVAQLRTIKVAPDEVLIVRFPETTDIEHMQEVADALGDIGLRGRSLVIVGDADLVTVPRDQVPTDLPVVHPGQTTLT